MTPERYQQIKAIVQKALDLRPADQTAFLETACAVMRNYARKSIHYLRTTSVPATFSKRR
jgi:hypothetical protein